MKEYVFPSRKAELANALTHGLGILFSMAVFITISMNTGRVFIHQFSLVVFASSMFLMYVASTTYHTISSIPLKKLFRLFDHINIYFLIAGTYTPFLLLCVKGSLGWLFFCIVWGVALCGIVYKLCWWQRHPRWSLFIYLGMGWLVVFIARPMFHTLSSAGWFWLLMGGACYTLGTVFYSWKSKTYTHAVWHLFVLGGSVSHFIAVMQIN